MDNDNKNGFELYKETKIMDLSEDEKVAVKDVLEIVIQRALAQLNSEIVETESKDNRVRPTPEEKKVVESFLHKVFKRAVEIVEKNEDISTSSRSKEEEEIPEDGEDDGSQSLRSNSTIGTESSEDIGQHSSCEISTDRTHEERGSYQEEEHSDYSSRDIGSDRDSQSPKEDVSGGEALENSLNSYEIALKLSNHSTDIKDDPDDIAGEGTSSQRTNVPFKFPNVSSVIKRQISAAVKAGMATHLPGGRVPEKPAPPQPAVNENSVNMQELKPYVQFITYGRKNTLGEDIIYLDPYKAPQKHNFEDHDLYQRLLDNLLTFTENFMEDNVKSDKFILVYRCLDVPNSHMMSFKWMGKFYHVLRDRYLHRLEKLIVYKPEMKLKALVKVCKPFIRRELSSKIIVITDPRTLAKEQRLPEMVQRGEQE